MKRALFALALAASPAWAQDPPPAPVVPVAAIDAPAFVTPGNRLVLLPGEGARSKEPLKYKLTAPKGAPFRLEGNALVIRDVMPVGTVYKFAAIATGDGGTFDFDFAEVPVLAAPTPTPVPPPNPPVDPVVPPQPPAPDDKPAIVGNMRVIILFESAAKLTRDQHDAIWSTQKVLPYLNAKCLKDTEGRPLWRVWDKDTILTYEPDWVAAKFAALAEPTAQPKAVVFAGNALVAAHAITTEDDLLAFLQSKGGK